MSNQHQAKPLHDATQSQPIKAYLRFHIKICGVGLPTNKISLWVKSSSGMHRIEALIKIYILVSFITSRSSKSTLGFSSLFKVFVSSSVHVRSKLQQVCVCARLCLCLRICVRVSVFIPACVNARACLCVCVCVALLIRYWWTMKDWVQGVGRDQVCRVPARWTSTRHGLGRGLHYLSGNIVTVSEEYVCACLCFQREQRMRYCNALCSIEGLVMMVNQKSNIFRVLRVWLHYLFIFLVCKL